MGTNTFHALHLKPNKLTIVIALLISMGVQGQLLDNILVVKNIYEVVQKNTATTKEVHSLTPKIDWSKVSSIKEVNERNTITFLAILNYEWRGITFQELKFQQLDYNKVLVSGTVMGRQPTECDGVITAFQHQWTLENGEIINFKEY